MSLTLIKNEKSMELPRVFRGEPLDVSTFSSAQRRKHGLSTLDTIVHVDTNEGLIEILEYARKKKRITVDCETDGEGDLALDPILNTLEIIQIGDTERQFIIWVNKITDWTPIEELFADETIVKFGQNLKFDIATWLAKKGLAKRWNNVADAAIIEQVLCCGLFSEDDDSVGMTLKMTSMENLARRWLGLNLDKSNEVRIGWKGYTKDTIPKDKLLYAADDVCVPPQIIAKQKPWIIRFALVETMNLEHAFLPVLADMEVRGIKMDMEQWDKLTDAALAGADKARRTLDDIFEVTITIELDEEGTPLFSRDKKYTSKDVLKDLIREYMLKHHNITVVATNRHFKEALIANGFNPERAERLFATTKVPNLKKPGKNKIVGGPNMSDLVEQYWEDYHTYLPHNSFFLPNSESKTLKLNKIIFDTPKDKRDDNLPNKIGLPGVMVDGILDLRKLSKAGGTYGYNWHKLVNEVTDRVHFEFVQAALTTGRTSSTPNCYDDQTEILSRNGWVKFTDLERGIEVAQVNPETLETSFVIPSNYIKYDFKGELIDIKSDQLGLRVTPDHRMLVELRSGRREIVSAEKLLPDRKHFHAGIFAGGQGQLTTDEIRLLVAIQADAHITPNGTIDFGFTKRRKYERLLEILYKLNVRFSDKSSDSRYRVLIPKVDISHIVELLGMSKLFGSYLLNQSRATLDAFVEELPYWEGCFTRKTTCYYSSNIKDNAEWVQAILSLSGLRARLRPYAAASGKTNWQVDVKHDNYSWTTGAVLTRVPYSGKVYCVTVPTGMLLVRRITDDGRYNVAVSGNCQNIPGLQAYRQCFIADRRKKARFIGSDFDQIEPRIIAQITNCFAYKRVFFSKHPERPEFKVYCNGVEEALDLYTEIGKMIGVIPDWMKVIHTKGNSETEPTKEGKKGRKQAKIVVLGLGYGTGKAKFYLTLVIDLGEVVPKGESDHLYDRFWEAVPEVKETLNQLSDIAYPGGEEKKWGKVIRKRSPRRLMHPLYDEEVTWAETLGGRKRFYRPKSFSWWTTGRNQPVQGTGADMLKRTMVLFARWCWKNLPAEFGLVNNIHDELLAEVPEDRDKECLEVLENIMRTVGESYVPDVPVTCAGYTAPYWVKD